MKILCTAPTGSPEWLAARKGKIGASQAAQVLGLDEHRSPLDAYCDIQGLNERTDNERMWAGRTFERACAEAWAERERKIVQPSPGLLQHERSPFLIGTPDFLYGSFQDDCAPAGVLECKWLNAWAEVDWAAQPPLVYVTQIQLYLELTGLEEGTLAVVFGGQKLHSVRVVKDEIYISTLLESLEEWHERHIVGNVAPNPRGEDVAQWIKLNPKDSGAVVALDDGERPLIEELEAVRAAKSSAEKRESELKSILAARCGDASAALCSDGYGITFRAQSVQHQAKEAYTSTSRVMRVTRKGLR